MSAVPILGVIVSTSRYSPEFIEGVFAFFAAVIVGALLPVWPGIRQTLASRSWRFRTIYILALIGLSVLTVLLIRDILIPDQRFRQTMVILGLTLAVAALPVCFVASLRSRGSWVRDYEFRGMSGRSLPSAIAAGWLGCLAVWIILVFPHADSGVVGLAALGCVVFFVLMFVTNSLASPKVLIPLGMRDTPGTLESRMAAGAHRNGRPTRGRRLKVPQLVTVIVDRKKGAGWHAWSTDLEDLKLDANTLEELDHSTQADLRQRFANPGQHSKLGLQFLVEKKPARPGNLRPTTGVPKEQLFEVRPRPEGGYTAQSVEQAAFEVHASTLDDLLSKAAATGSKTVRLTWSHDLTL